MSYRDGMSWDEWMKLQIDVRSPPDNRPTWKDYVVDAARYHQELRDFSGDLWQFAMWILHMSYGAGEISWIDIDQGMQRLMAEVKKKRDEQLRSANAKT